jgi:hypothetical protein
LPWQVCKRPLNCPTSTGKSYLTTEKQRAKLALALNQQLAQTLPMCISAVRLTEQKVENKIQQPNRQLTKEERLRNMKRVVGFFAVVVLALTLGIAAYGKASPKRNLGAKAAASAPQVSSTQDKTKMK